jgi:hypothetical protein
MMMVFLFLLPAVLFAQHPTVLTGLHNDKALLLLSYQESLLDLDANVAPLIAPHHAALAGTSLLSEARITTDQQLADAARVLQKKLLALSWLSAELHDSSAQSQLLSQSLRRGLTRADHVLSRVAQSRGQLADLRKQEDRVNTDLYRNIHALQTYYMDTSVLQAELTHRLDQQYAKQALLSLYDNTLLNLLYGRPVTGKFSKSTKRLTPFSSYIPSPVSGRVLASQHFPGLGFGVVIGQHHAYTLVTGLAEPEVLPGSMITTGTILGTLHDSAADVQVATWLKQDPE